MYTQRTITLEHDPKPLENRALLNAVRHISGSLVHRTHLYPRQSYANLLAQIWGESRYATVDVLVEKRLQLEQKLRQKHDQKLPNIHERDSSYRKSTSAQQQPQPHQSLQNQKQRRKNVGRDRLVAILRAVKDDDIIINERKLTINILQRQGNIDVDALRRLWAVPNIIFEVAGLQSYLQASHDINLVIHFYQTHVMRESPDSRIFNILYWKENFQPQTGTTPCNAVSKKHRTISSHTIGLVIKNLLTKRRSPFYEKNMDVVIETVLYAIHPDGFIDRFREAALRKAGFFRGLVAYEYSRSFTASLQNLHLGKLNRMLKDIRAVRGIDGTDLANGDTEKQNSLSLRAISKYCAERNTLTERALQGVYDRYVRHRGCTLGNANDIHMTVPDFVRMYLALVGCGTDPGLKYWFSILDQDGDGWVGVSDVAHFYAERKLESEKRNGILLADVQYLWIRLCAMLGISPNGKGIDLHSLRELGKDEREFVMCALLVRRVDDGNLINVAATVSNDPEAAKTL